MDNNIKELAILLNHSWKHLAAIETAYKQVYEFNEELCSDLKAEGIFSEVWEAANSLNEQGEANG